MYGKCSVNGPIFAICKMPEFFNRIKYEQEIKSALKPLKVMEFERTLRENQRPGHHPAVAMETMNHDLEAKAKMYR